MSTLLLRLAGPLQAWGDSSRFTRRETRTEPTKSGVLGMIAAAQGRRRTDPLEDLLQLRFGVRADQPGSLIRDYQTAVRWPKDNRPITKDDRLPVSDRFYLSDAIFLAGVEGDRELLEGIVDALLHPAYPLYLGRRSCPPHWQLIAWRDSGTREALFDSGLLKALTEYPWLACSAHKRTLGPKVTLALAIDREAVDGEHGDRYTSRDVPISFDPVRRTYGWRDVVRMAIEMDNDLSRRSPEDPDFFGTAVAVAATEA